MLHGAINGGLELRKKGRGGYSLRGAFPYGRVAVLSDGGRRGRPRKEVIAPRAFEYRVQEETAEIHLLSGHDFAKPLASKQAGSLVLRDSDTALTFEAEIGEELAEVSYVRDLLAAHSAGLVTGISPGFRIPPERAVPKAETVEREPERPEEGMHGALIRTVHSALLFELSLVTRPAFPDTESQVSARSWRLEEEERPALRVVNYARWR